MEVFSPTMLDKVCSMFPSNLGCKLSRCDENEINDHVEQNESVMSLLYVVDNDIVGDLYLQQCPGFDN